MCRIENFTLIIGSMKCGTTSLFNYLSQHPQVCASSVKEPMYFSRDGYTDGMDGYSSLWEGFDPQTHRTALEASTEYTKIPDFPNVAERLKNFADENQVNFKLIYIVRNPVSMIKSGLRHGKEAGWYKHREDLLAHLVTVADFSSQLAVYEEQFSETDILVLQFEELLVEPEQVMQRVIQFLCLDEQYKFLNLKKVYNSGRQRDHERDIKDMGDQVDKIRMIRFGKRIVPASLKRIVKPLL